MQKIGINTGGADPAMGLAMDFNQVYKTYSLYIQKVISKIFRDYATVQDTCQLAWIKVAELLPKYDSSKSSLITWLYQIALNTALDVLKSAAHQRAGKALPIEDDDFADNIKLSDLISYDSIGLKTLLKVLKEDQRMVIQLYYLDGYTQIEVSKELRMPLSTVKSIIRRSLNKLRVVWFEEIGYYYGTII